MTEATKDAPSLYAKLAEVAKAVEGVEKDGRNNFHNYDYTTAEAMLRAIRRPLLDQGVVLLTRRTGIDERDFTTEKGKTSTITTVDLDFAFVDTATGERETLAWSGRGDDPVDKGLGKAYTNAVKTFLREQFLLPMGDDPEADHATDERAVGRVSAPSNGRSSSGPIAPSDKQLEFLTGLARDGGADGSEQETIRAYAAANLTGGKEGSTSKTIELLKGEEAGATLARMVAKAEEWQSKQTDVAVDTEGLSV